MHWFRHFERMAVETPSASDGCVLSFNPFGLKGAVMGTIRHEAILSGARPDLAPRLFLKSSRSIHTRECSHAHRRVGKHACDAISLSDLVSRQTSRAGSQNRENLCELPMARPVSRPLKRSQAGSRRRRDIPTMRTLAERLDLPVGILRRLPKHVTFSMPSLTTRALDRELLHEAVDEDVVRLFVDADEGYSYALSEGASKGHWSWKSLEAFGPGAVRDDRRYIKQARKTRKRKAAAENLRIQRRAAVIPGSSIFDVDSTQFYRDIYERMRVGRSTIVGTIPQREAFKKTHFPGMQLQFLPRSLHGRVPMVGIFPKVFVDAHASFTQKQLQARSVVNRSRGGRSGYRGYGRGSMPIRNIPSETQGSTPNRTESTASSSRKLASISSGAVVNPDTSSKDKLYRLPKESRRILSTRQVLASRPDIASWSLQWRPRRRRNRDGKFVAVLAKEIGVLFGGNRG